LGLLELGIFGVDATEVRLDPAVVDVAGFGRALPPVGERLFLGAFARGDPLALETQTFARRLAALLCPEEVDHDRRMAVLLIGVLVTIDTHVDEPALAATRLFPFRELVADRDAVRFVVFALDAAMLQLLAILVPYVHHVGRTGRRGGRLRGAVGLRLGCRARDCGYWSSVGSDGGSRGSVRRLGNGRVHCRAGSRATGHRREPERG